METTYAAQLLADDAMRRPVFSDLALCGSGLAKMARISPSGADARGTRVPAGVLGGRGRFGVPAPISARLRAMSVVR
ncbi:hypothetical protein Bcav_2893 [Beutenbergia cavernae DSM 12333]|uniref:Uncharacterized protein n=1 Tax=Beutenbergia cavernae (strain ATCC BAA-8 / DSM 12333 / CCUG 43141 / JCM 11478 / NBRC 16432 / NCIMB 13614 / HKI 0122) TaxID=471853 RepID=C5BZ23_BEUC1|nr:hypothetical protein [Beutenbergia cavernae]ACQ81138.1 hypothetical protein Bcav_2893 [Beutenbergia cavernae DSM 12333]